MNVEAFINLYAVVSPNSYTFRTAKLRFFFNCASVIY